MSPETDQWVIATWHAYYHVELHFVLRKADRPRADYNPTPSPHEAYKWNSYHAARKFLKENETLGGYIILNLSDIIRQCHAVDRRTS